MKRISKKIFIALAVLAVAGSSVSSEAGCHGRSGRSYGGYGHARVSYPAPRVVYSQPVYVQSPQMIPTQPVITQPYPGAAPGTPVGIPTQPASPQFPNPFGDSSASAPSADSILTGAQTPGQAPVSGQAPAPGQVPVSGQAQVSSPGASDLQTSTTGGASLPSGSASTDTTTSNAAELSALQALGGFAPPQSSVTEQPASTANQSTAPNTGFVGNWTAELGNGAKVRLTLQQDGSFVWNATSASGSSTSFQGSYAISGGQLALTRSGDSQQLSGAFSSAGQNAFSFKLATGNAASLEFRRS